MKPWPLAVLLPIALAGWADSSDRTDTPREFEAVLRPVRTMEISSASVGLLERVEVERGDRVTAGQVLAVLESEVERADVEVLRVRAESNTAVEMAEVQVGRSVARLEQAERLSRDGVISSEELEDVRAARDLAGLGLRRAREDRSLAQRELKRAQARLEQRTVRSPVDGVVAERFLSPGELVDRSENDAIVQLTQLDPLVVDVRIPQELLRSLVPGTRALVHPESPLEEVFECQITSVDPVVDAASGSLRVRLELPNPDHTIPAGLRCRVRFLE